VSKPLGPEPPSSTATALEALTDAGVFELLATAVIRALSSDYSTAVHLGVSAQGKPVKSPVDAIAEVPSASPRHVIAIQHTTVEKSELRRKWLGPQGDLAKALEIIVDVRRRAPDAKMTLVLATNRVPDLALIQDTTERARQMQIIVDVVDRSRLSSFLDDDPNGQYLRRKYLGTAQRRLSAGLLHELSERSWETFVMQIHDDPRRWIDRELDNTLTRRVENGIPGTFLVTASGMGKSAAMARLMQRSLQRDGAYALWIPESLVEQSITLDSAIWTALSSLAPDLELEASAARALATPNSPLVLIIDDISRSREPGRQLERVVGWIRHEESSGSAIRLICAAQPQLLEHLSANAKRELERRSISHGAFSETEATAALLERVSAAGRTMSTTEAHELAARLAYDPLLISLAWSQNEFETDIRHVIPVFIDHQLGRCQGLAGAFSLTEHRQALVALAEKMLAERSLSPRWTQVVSWLGEGSMLARLRNIARQGEVIRVESSAGSETVRFRHDRVRDIVLATAINAHSPVELLSDPHFAEVVGIAVANSKSNELLQAVRDINPLALCYALGRANDEHQSSELVGAIIEWMNKHSTMRERTKHVQWAMQFVLAQTDNARVPDIVRRFTVRGANQSWAMLRNGEAKAALRIFSFYGPHSRFPYRDNLLGHVMLKYGQTFTQQVGALLADEELTPEQRRGALNLAGFLATPNLSLNIKRAWSRWGSDPQFFSEFLWAALSCTSERPDLLLDDMMNFWEKLPEKDNQGTEFSRTSGLEELQVPFNRLVSDAVVYYLIRQSAREALSWPIQVLLRHANHPAAAEFTAKRYAAVSKARSEGAELWWSLDDYNAFRWSLSSRVRDHLRSLFDAKESDGFLRRAAFALWTQHSTLADIPLLSSLASDRDLSERAMRTRVRLGDRSVLPLLRSKVEGETDPAMELQFARGSWDDDLLPVIEDVLQRRREQPTHFTKNGFSDSIIADLLVQCSAPVAESLLTDHWDHLGGHSDYICCALFVATRRCRELVRASMHSLQGSEVLAHLGMRWHIGGTEQKGRLSADRLEAIEAYLDMVDEMGIYDLWRACNVDGFFDWRRTHLDKRLGHQYRQHHVLDQEDAWRELDALSKEDRHGMAEFFVSHFLEEGGSRDALLQFVSRWLHARHSISAMAVAAEIFSLVGSRCDLVLLAGIDIPGAEDLLADTDYAIRLRSLQ
jgi:hypothetical protein